MVSQDDSSDHSDAQLGASSGKDSDQDNLFRQEMRGVRLLPPTGRVHLRKTPKSTTSKRHSSLRGGNESVMHEDHADCSVSAALSLELKQSVGGRDRLSFSRPGIQNRLLKKLRTGQLSIEAELDLHGYRLEAARDQCRDFLLNAIQRRYRVVSIVHGKGLHAGGDALLKSYVDQWLQALPCVLAYSSAPTSLGGTGAVLILLRLEQSKH